MQPTRARYRVLFLCLAIVGVAYIDRVAISTAAPTIQKDLALTDGQMGLVFSAFAIAYALFEFPGGWFADRFGARKALMRIVVWWSVMTAATGLATGFLSLVALRWLFGAGEGGCLPTISTVIERWFPEQTRARLFALNAFSSTFFGALTQPLVVMLLEVIRWQTMFACFGLLGLVWCTIWALYFRDDPREHPGVNAAELALIGAPAREKRPPVPWRALLRNRTMICVSLGYLCVIYGWSFFLTWLPTYLLRARDFNLKQAGFLSALPILGLGCGVLVGGLASDLLVPRLGRRLGRRLPVLCGMPLAAVTFVAAVRAEAPISAVALMSLAAGLSSMSIPPSWAVCLDVCPELPGAMTGVMNTFGSLGGALLPAGIGWALDHLHSWTPGLMSIPVAYLLCAIIWTMIDPDERLAAVA